MASTLSTDDSATLGTLVTLDSAPLAAGAGRTYVRDYDLRADDERSTSTPSTPSMSGTTILSSAASLNLRVRADSYGSHADDLRSAATPSVNGRTILSSAAPSSLTQSLPDNNNHTDGGAMPNAPSLSLSLNPSMIDSSVIIPNNASGNWMGLLHRTHPSQSSLSCSDILSCAADSHSTSSHAPELLSNICRSLVFASESAMPSGGADDGVAPTVADADDNESSRDQASSKTPGMTGSGKVKWWDKLQTDEDWDNFRKNANDYLNTLIVEEMRDAKRCEGRDGNGWKECVDKAPISKEVAQQRNGLPAIRLWFKSFCDALSAATTAGIISGEYKPPGAKHLSSLVREAAEIRQQLEGLPPMPPALPEGLPLDELPHESRDLLLQYRDRLDAWRGEAMPRRDALAARYAQCQEELLAAIIDSEEEAFYGHRGNRKNQERGMEGVANDKVERNASGASNKDGYIEVIDGKSPLWDDVYEASVLTQNKCHSMTLLSALVAALTAGAGLFFKLQSNRR